MSGQSKGYLCALVGGVLSLIAFFFMPCASSGLFSFTAAELVQSSNPFVTSLSQQLGLQLLWLEPAIAAVICILAGFNLRTVIPAQKGTGQAITILVLSVLAFALLIGLYVHVSRVLQGSSTSDFSSASVNPVSLLGAGFWCLLIGMGLSFVGSIIVLNSRSTPIVP